jgi:hypothetical protein
MTLILLDQDFYHMHTPSKSQNGFGSLQILAILLAIAVIGSTGVVVFRYDRKSTSDLAAPRISAPNSDSTTSSNAQSAQTAQQSLDIPEWGVRMTLDSNTASLYYYISPENPDVAYLSLKTVSDIAPLCAADKTSLGAIDRLTNAEQQAITDGTNYGHAGSIRVGNYWYGFESPNAACVPDAATQQAIANAQPSYNLLNVFNTLAAD